MTRHLKFYYKYSLKVFLFLSSPWRALEGAASTTERHECEWGEHEGNVMKSIRNERKVRKRKIEQNKITVAQVRPCVEREREGEKHKTVKMKMKKKKAKKKRPVAQEEERQEEAE